MLDRFSLKDKVVVLTGGAGLYGRGLSHDLAAADATLIIASRNKASCEEVAADLRAKGFTASGEVLDQGDEASIIALRDRVLEKFGRIDGLVNNSVLRTKQEGPSPLKSWADSMKVNSDGIFLMHHYFGETMLAQKSGSIVNIGSIMGIIGPSLNLYEGLNMGDPSADYFFHKGGMVNLTRYFGSMLGRGGVRVNCLSPGGFFNNQDPEFVRRYSAQTFLNRMGNDTDLGGSVIFLLSDASLYVTGTNIPVDGGYTAK